MSENLILSYMLFAGGSLLLCITLFLFYMITKGFNTLEYFWSFGTLLALWIGFSGFIIVNEGNKILEGEKSFFSCEGLEND